MSSEDLPKLNPRESGEFIADNADHVTIVEEGVQEAAKLVWQHVSSTDGAALGAGYRSHPLHPRPSDPAAVDWVFLVTTLNFNFWAPDGHPKYGVRQDGVLYDGYYSVCAAVKRALQEGVPVTDPKHYSQLDEAAMRRLLRSDTAAEIPLLLERLKAVTEAGQVLVQRYGGSFVNCVRQCDGSAQRLLRLVADEFPSFRDEACFKGRRVSLYKRAQILIADLWLCFDGEGLGRFDDITSLTMFADYRVPQTLAYLGALQYSAELTAALQSEQLLQSGDPREVEIRGCSIAAVERVVAAVRQMSPVSLPDHRLNSIVVDNFLWGYRRDHVKETNTAPYHRIRCIYY